MMGSFLWLKGLVLGAIIAALMGCAASPKPSPVVIAPVPESTVLISLYDDNAGVNLVSELAALNISIAEFAVAHEGDTLTSALNQVRAVERRYVPYQLKATLDRAGYWGAVRVMPLPDPGAELQITGELVQSDGIVLVLNLTARDATGRVWLEKTYNDRAGPLDYAVDPDYRRDPFDDIYHRIANDLYEAQSLISAEERARVIDVTTMRYARELAPDVFGRYLTETNGRLLLNGLPALDDPLFERVARIRNSEYLFTDSVDAHYESLRQRVGPTYAWWRYYSYELTMGNRRLEGIDATRGATRGSWYAMERIYKTYKESKMNEDALRELTASFDRETAPTIAELSGRVVRLTGTLEKQYQEWRDILKEMYRAETGF